jgi:hypothetical protein
MVHEMELSKSSTSAQQEVMHINETMHNSPRAHSKEAKHNKETTKLTKSA